MSVASSIECVTVHRCRVVNRGHALGTQGISEKFLPTLESKQLGPCAGEGSVDIKGSWRAELNIRNNQGGRYVALLPPGSKRARVGLDERGVAYNERTIMVVITWIRRA